MGTMIMVLLGNGVVAGVSLRKTNAENAGWIVVVTAWALAVLCGIFTAMLFGSKDGHLNPAITLAFAIENHDFAKLASYVPAQLAGGFAGAILVWLFYFPHWAVTEDAEAKRGCFCTIPAIRAYPANLFCEAVATFVLVIVAGSINSKLVLTAGAPPGFGPYLVGSLVWGIGLSLGSTTGYAINPARDLGPRIAHALLPIAGKAHSDWSYAWVPVLGPVLGAGAAGWVLHALGA